jgi:hypothetical protein
VDDKRKKDGLTRRELLMLLGKITVAAGAGSVVATVLPGCGDGGSNGDPQVPAGCTLLQRVPAGYYIYDALDCADAVSQANTYCYFYADYAYYYSGGKGSFRCMHWYRAE